MAVLAGDVNATGNISGSDVNVCKSVIGATVSASNFRNDVNANGSVTGSDVNLIKAQIGMALQ